MSNPKQQFNVYLSSNTVRRIKHCSIDEQSSLSDLVERVLLNYLDLPKEEVMSESTKPITNVSDASADAKPSTLQLQPMLHVDDMGNALSFFQALGGTISSGSRDGDWSIVQFGTTELSLLAHPANPEQNEGKLELNFVTEEPLENLESRLREAAICIARPTGDEGFGYQLQLTGPDGLLVKINQLDPTLYQ